MLWVILIVLVLLALAGGLWAGPAYGPWWGWSPLVTILLVAVVLLLLGVVHP